MTPAIAPVYFSGAVEGIVDEAAARRLIDHVGGALGVPYGRNGKEYLRERINGFNTAAAHSPWFVLVDLDHEADCAPPMRTVWLSNPARYMCFRIAVREIEAWLMGDRQRLAGFLRVAQSRIPHEPEGVADPKQVMVDIARASRRRSIVQDMVPRPGSGVMIGPAYSSRLVEFIQAPAGGWRPRVAARRVPSLARNIIRLRQIIEVGRRLQSGR